jgi:DNA-binding beta-propeller fold protein YncE
MRPTVPAGAIVSGPVQDGRQLTRRLVLAASVAVVAMLAAVAASPSGADPRKPPPPERTTRSVIFVGNNWEGTADVIQPFGDFHRIARLNIIPDIDERMAEISTNPVRLGYFLAIRELVGEGNDQFVDDMYSTNDGRLLIVSRPSLADVVGIDIASGEIVWRFVVDGQRSDHMAISPDGHHVAVSASTGNVVHILDTQTGVEVGRFGSGDSPHENNYSDDGELIYHASIGLVYTPADDPTVDTSKGDRWFQVVDADTNEVLERIDMGQKLAEAGYPGMSSAVRPMALTPNENKVYFQVSFFHGFVEYNFKQDRVTRVANLPIADEVQGMPREDYLLDSAHHGIAMSGDGKRLCVAGTMSDYAAIVSRKSFRYKRFNLGEKPYWSTTSNNGRRCFVSWSGTDSISVISYRKRKEIAHIPVGDHPQRIRMGRVRTDWIRSLR